MRISAKTIVELAGFDLAKTTSAFISGSKFNDLDTVASAKPKSVLKVRAGGETKEATIPETLNEAQEKCLDVAKAKKAKAIEARQQDRK